MPDRVHMEAEAMCGTMTALLHCSRPGFIEGSSSNTSRPHLRGHGKKDGWGWVRGKGERAHKEGACQRERERKLMHVNGVEDLT